MPPTVDTIDKCQGCPVRQKFPESRFIQPLIVPGNRIAIAEAGGANEALEGTPLVGASGNWLRGREVEGQPGKRTGGLYKAAGVDGSTVSLCNVINCSIAADHKNVFPTDPEARAYISKPDAESAVEHCLKNHVNPILADSRWTRIDILGDKALRNLTGLEGGILRWRGSPTVVPATGRSTPSAIPTLHPAALARDQSLLPAVVRDLQKTLDVPDEHYNTSPSIEEVRAFTATELAFDIECVRETGQITMVGLCAKSGHAICVPFHGIYVDEFKRILAAATLVVGHNCLQFDLPRLKDVGVNLPATCQVFDTMLGQHLLQPDLPHGLDFLGSFFTNKPAWKHLSGADEALYCCRDVDVTWQCFLQLRPMLRAEKLLDLYQNVQVPLARICYLLHETGFKIDPARLKIVRADLENKSQELELRLPAELRTQERAVRKRVLAPPGTLSEKTHKPLKYIMMDATETVSPWKSSEVLKIYFYEKAFLPVQTHAKTNEPTTDKTAIPKLIRAASSAAYSKTHGLERAQEVIAALRALQSIRQIASLLSTFVKDKWENSRVERIHASFNVHGTASGRLSSSDPNLQNIPESVRYIYVPSYSDWAIFDVDFSSLENRLTAWFAQDSERLERLSQPGFNEHKWTTSQFFDIPYDEVVKDNSKDAPYGKAKRIGHGSNYGMGPLKISRLFDLPFDEVKVLCNRWKQVNAKTVEWQLATAAKAKTDGFLVTPFQRKRWLYTDSFYTESLSFLPQSTGADIMFRTMIGLLYDRIGWPESQVQKVVQIYRPLPPPARLLVTVHDSLVIEGPASMETEILETVKLVASQSWPELGGFAIPVETKTGPSWGEAK